jgi:hypothetical protein
MYGAKYLFDCRSFTVGAKNCSLSISFGTQNLG